MTESLPFGEPRYMQLYVVTMKRRFMRRLELPEGVKADCQSVTPLQVPILSSQRLGRGGHARKDRRVIGEWIWH
jgi:hypothetical protein